MTPKAIKHMELSGVLVDAEWTIETLEGFEEKAQRAQTVPMSDQSRSEIVSNWTESVVWILANDTRADVLSVARAMSGRM